MTKRDELFFLEKATGIPVDFKEVEHPRGFGGKFRSKPKTADDKTINLAVYGPLRVGMDAVMDNGLIVNIRGMFKKGGHFYAAVVTQGGVALHFGLEKLKPLADPIPPKVPSRVTVPSTPPSMPAPPFALPVPVKDTPVPVSSHNNNADFKIGDVVRRVGQKANMGVVAGFDAHGNVKINDVNGKLFAVILPTKIEMVPAGDKDLKAGDRVCHKDEKDALGTVLEMNADGKRAKIKWDDGIGDGWGYLNVLRKVAGDAALPKAPGDEWDGFKAGDRVVFGAAGIKGKIAGFVKKGNGVVARVVRDKDKGENYVPPFQLMPNLNPTSQQEVEEAPKAEDAAVPAFKVGELVRILNGARKGHLGEVAEVRDGATYPFKVVPFDADNLPMPSKVYRADELEMRAPAVPTTPSPQTIGPFKVGQRVQFLGHPEMQGVVVGPGDRVDRAIGIKWDDGATGYPSLYNVEPVKGEAPKPPIVLPHDPAMFKVGDHVQWQDKNGRTRYGAIHSLPEPEQNTMQVDWDGGSTYPNGMLLKIDKQKIKPADKAPEPPKAHVFVAGDRVSYMNDPKDTGIVEVIVGKKARVRWDKDNTTSVEDVAELAYIPKAKLPEPASLVGDVFPSRPFVTGDRVVARGGYVQGTVVNVVEGGNRAKVQWDGGGVSIGRGDKFKHVDPPPGAAPRPQRIPYAGIFKPGDKVFGGRGVGTVMQVGSLNGNRVEVSFNNYYGKGQAGRSWVEESSLRLIGDDPAKQLAVLGVRIGDDVSLSGQPTSGGDDQQVKIIGINPSKEKPFDVQYLDRYGSLGKEVTSIGLDDFYFAGWPLDRYNKIPAAAPVPAEQKRNGWSIGDNAMANRIGRVKVVGFVGGTVGRTIKVQDARGGIREIDYGDLVRLSPSDTPSQDLVLPGREVPRFAPGSFVAKNGKAGEVVAVPAEGLHDTALQGKTFVHWFGGGYDWIDNDKIRDLNELAGGQQGSPVGKWVKSRNTSKIGLIVAVGGAGNFYSSNLVQVQWLDGDQDWQDASNLRSLKEKPNIWSDPYALDEKAEAEGLYEARHGYGNSYIESHTESDGDVVEVYNQEFRDIYDSVLAKYGKPVLPWYNVGDYVYVPSLNHFGPVIKVNRESISIGGLSETTWVQRSQAQAMPHIPEEARQPYKVGLTVKVGDTDFILRGFDVADPNVGIFKGTERHLIHIPLAVAGIGLPSQKLIQKKQAEAEKKRLEEEEQRRKEHEAVVAKLRERHADLIQRYGEGIAAQIASMEDHEAVMKTGKVLDRYKKLGSGHVNAVYRTQVQGSDGATMEIVAKPNSGADKSVLREGIKPGNDGGREQAAYIINKFMGGLVEMPEVIVRSDTPMGKSIIQRFIGDTDDMYADATSSLRNKVTKDEYRDIALLDSLIGNCDRHGGNLMVRAEPQEGQKHIVAIDHGLAFPAPEERNGYSSPFEGNAIIQDMIGSKPLDVREKAALEQLFNLRGDVDGQLRALLPSGAVDDFWERANYIRQKGVTLSGSQMQHMIWDDTGRWDGHDY